MNTGRSGASRQALENVRSRHEALQKALRQIIEVNRLFEEMSEIVITQDPVVARVNEQSQVVQENVAQANTQLNGAIKSARAANRKKWWCLGIARQSFP